jgi:hypothetical protein
MTQVESLVRAEFDHLIDCAGLAVSEGRRAELASTYADLKKQLELLRGPRRPDAEPSNVFHLSLSGTES